jgi:hypothetical protein
MGKPALNRFSRPCAMILSCVCPLVNVQEFADRRVRKDRINDLPALTAIAILAKKERGKDGDS